MTNKELAAQCLIEAANILGESSGKNGSSGKYLRIIRDNEKDKNDKLEAEADYKYPQYARAGHEDKIKYPKRYKEHELGRAMVKDKQLIQTDKDYRKKDITDRMQTLNKTTKNQVNRITKHQTPESSDRVKEIHDRINRRNQNESIDIICDNIDFSDILD